MKKTILCAVFALLTASGTKAQITNNDSREKRGYLNLAVNLHGFGGYTVPPLIFTGETVFKDTWSIEAGLGHISYMSDETYGIKTSAFSMGAYFGANYYLNQLLKLDMDKFTLSGGAGLMYLSTTISNDSEYVGSTSANDFSFVGNVKGRYFFTPKFALLAQVNFGKGDSTIFGGLSYRLK